MVDDDHEIGDVQMRILLAGGWFMVQRDVPTMTWRFAGGDGRHHEIRAETLSDALHILIWQIEGKVAESDP